LQSLGQAGLAHFEQLCFSLVEDTDRFPALVSGLGNGGRADAHQPPQQALVLDDADVVLDHRPPRQAFGQRCQVGYATDRLDLFVAGKLVRERDDINCASRVNQLAHPQKDAAVRIEREIVGFESLRSLSVGCVIEQNRAQNGLFRVDIRG
jgi:hypothetical protein